MSATIKAKIKALLAKTTANGCTEAEALAAAEMAAKLMRKHQLDEADLDLTAGSAPERTTRTVWRVKLARIIAHCTNTSFIFVAEVDGHQIMFVGRDPGPEIALYLRDICIRAVDDAVKSFKGTDVYLSRRKTKTRRAAVKDFVEGMVARLGRRLVDIFGPLRDKGAAEEAGRYLKTLFPDAKTSTSKRWKSRFESAAYLGIRAGDGVALNRGVNGAEDPRMLS